VTDNLLMCTVQSGGYKVAGKTQAQPTWHAWVDTVMCSVWLVC